MAGRFLGKPGSRRRQRSVAFALFAALIAVTAVAVPSLANLPGSTFESNDGNLVVNTAGNQDWVNAPSREAGVELFQGRQDNSFGQGTKEDDANVSVVTGSIPPQKSDLTRFYIANETVSNVNFLYLAWERSNVLGSANMDFEINQEEQPDLTTTGPKTLIRTAGDILVTFDFTNGGGNPVLGALKWLTGNETPTAATKNDCFSANALPCWGAIGDDEDGDDSLDGFDDERIDLSQAGFADGAINTGTVPDPIANVSLPGLTFGEAAINLTDSGIITPGSCEGFSSAFLKSRSSASFPAEVKDFVAPVPVNINNCGAIKVKKTDDAGNAIGNVKFLAYKDVAPLKPDQANQTKHGGEDEPAAGNCITALATDPGPPATVKGECTIENLTPGNYWVEEDPTTVPGDYSATAVPKYVTVTAGGTANAFNPGFVNPRKHKVIVIVCHQGTNTFAQSDVTNNVANPLSSTTLTSLATGATLPTGVTESGVCSLTDGAVYGGKEHQLDDDYDVDIGMVGGVVYSPHN